jgi:imidazoleglycerol-phosphate dehydratase
MSPAKKSSPAAPSASRTATARRVTAETSITVTLDLDGDGSFSGETGIPFFDHMLTLLARHGALSLEIKAKGDIAVDCHHTVEDVGLLFGRLLAEAAGNKAGIRRYGHAVIPMEESLCETTLDFCGRPYLFFSAEFGRDLIENYATECTEDFFRAVANTAGLTMHIECRRGRNAHHIVEGIFKSFARALRQSVSLDERLKGIPSTKGTL